jgi:hypothetical protein
MISNTLPLLLHKIIQLLGECFLSHHTRGTCSGPSGTFA